MDKSVKNSSKKLAIIAFVLSLGWIFMIFLGIKMFAFSLDSSDPVIYFFSLPSLILSIVGCALGVFVFFKYKAEDGGREWAIRAIIMGVIGVGYSLVAYFL